MFTSISQSWRCSKYVPLATSPTTEDPEAQPGSLHNRYAKSRLCEVVLMPDRPRRRDILHSLPLQVLNRPRLLIFTPLILLPILYLLISSKFGPGAHRIPLSDNPYFYTGEVWEHNDLVSAKLDRCASLGLLRNTSLPLAPHEQLSADEEGELIAQGCGTNETTVIVLSSIFFAEAFKGINTAGEAIYAQSIMSSLNALSYSFVFSSLGWWNHDMRKSMELFHKHRWNTRMILADPEQVDVCWNQEDQKCLKTMENPEGIEAWRLLSFWYWDECVLDNQSRSCKLIWLQQSTKPSRRWIHTLSLSSKRQPFPLLLDRTDLSSTPIPCTRGSITSSPSVPPRQTGPISLRHAQVLLDHSLPCQSSVESRYPSGRGYEQ